MEVYYEKQLPVLVSRCDASGKLGIPECAQLFMDMANEHQEMLGSGVYELAKEGKFWVTVKTKLHFEERPRLLDSLVISTWPSRPMMFYGDRHYMIQKEGKAAVTGRTQWAIVNRETGRPVSMEDLYPDDTVFREDMALKESFTTVKNKFNWESFSKYRVLSADIDIGRHMNNAAYIRAFECLFTVDEWQRMDIRDLEIHYRASCFEGDELTFYRAVEPETGRTFYKIMTGERLNGHIIIR